MDFRVIYYAGKQVLLERIESDGHWQMIISVYVEEVHRFDEWESFAEPAQAQARIAAYTTQDVHQFLLRALAWWNAKYPVKHLDDLTHK